MPQRRCLYCKECFFPSRFHPDQMVCGARACQRRRRTDYHRQKLSDDPGYREQCKDSQRLWREQHPEYMPSYRRRRGTPASDKPTLQELIAGLLLNERAVELTRYPARVWVICSDAFVKNTLAQAQLIVVEGAIQIA
jgi:hypothetical protein